MSSLLRSAHKRGMNTVHNSSRILSSARSVRLISTSLSSKDNNGTTSGVPFRGYKAPHKAKELLSYQQANNLTFKESSFESKQKTDFGSYTKTHFTEKITEEEAVLIPSVLALHSRLKLSDNFKKSTIVRALTCPMENQSLADNASLSLFGSHLLSFYTHEYFMANYPRLPYSIQKLATDAYIGDFSLYDVAKIWGIEEDITSNLEKYLSNEPKLHRYGRLRYDNQVVEVEPGLTQIKASDTGIKHVKVAVAHSLAVRSIIAGVYAHDGEEAAKDFIYKHILSRKVDLTKMFKFEGPGRLLSKLLKTRNMEQPSVRLMSETGRLSKYPIFNVGVFSGDSLLGEGSGSSLREARVRATVNSLMAFYLYRPLEPTLTSQKDFKPLFVDDGEAFF